MKLTPLKSLCLMLIGTAFATQAAINLDRTRIVFPETDKASSLKVDNQSKTLPILRSPGSKTKTVVRKTATLWRFLRSSALNPDRHPRSGS
jgi:P pilus assembly chaperone PapD